MLTLTQSPLGFKEESDVYKLRQSMIEFQSSFGQADKIEEINWTNEKKKLGKSAGKKRAFLKSFRANTKEHSYYKEGLEVVEDPTGKIQTFIFYIASQRDFNASEVYCENNMIINQQSSVREITKNFGQPTKRREDQGVKPPAGLELEGFGIPESICIDYHLNDGWLTFVFSEGILTRIWITLRSQ
ncbi:MAG: hypothetical protein PHR06_07720 [Candidatus Cloacimonetes bacterium]|nr:hypothetical protein [Candidatus Cloacimonadota bacterium]